MDSPLRLKTEAEFEVKAFEIRIREASLEDARSLACDIFRQYLWIKQFFTDSIKSDAPTLASLQTQNAEMRNHLEQLKALNTVLRQDVETLKVEISQLKDEQQAAPILKNEDCIKTWGYLQDARVEILELLSLLETSEGVDKVFVSLSIRSIGHLLVIADLAIPGQDPPEEELV